MAIFGGAKRCGENFAINCGGKYGLEGEGGDIGNGGCLKSGKRLLRERGG
jgi:hypothetical protein